MSVPVNMPSDGDLMTTSSGGSGGVGHITSWDTLDEPIWTTINRDLSGIALKLQHILLPISSERDTYRTVCKNWDLWGPFIFSTYIAFSANHCGEDCRIGMANHSYHQSNFSSIFVLLWLGNLALCLNYRLLSSNSIEQNRNAAGDQSEQPGAARSANSNSNQIRYPVSIFQLLCLFGYTLAIPSIGILLMQVLRLITADRQHILERIVVTFVFGFAYPVTSTLKTLSSYISSEKYFLVVYPILLFFTILSLYLYTFA